MFKILNHDNFISIKTHFIVVQKRKAGQKTAGFYGMLSILLHAVCTSLHRVTFFMTSKYVSKRKYEYLTTFYSIFMKEILRQNKH